MDWFTLLTIGSNLRDCSIHGNLLLKSAFQEEKKRREKKNRLGREKKQRGRAADRFNDTNYSAVVRTALTADGLHRRRIQSVALLSLFLFLNAPKRFLATREIQVF